MPPLSNKKPNELTLEPLLLLPAHAEALRIINNHGDEPEPSELTRPNFAVPSIYLLRGDIWKLRFTRNHVRRMCMAEVEAGTPTAKDLQRYDGVLSTLAQILAAERII